MLPRARNFCCYSPLIYQPNACWQAAGRPEEFREPHPTDKLFNHEKIEAGKRHALIGMVKTHAASVKVILLLFSDRENLLLLTLDGRRLHGK